MTNINYSFLRMVCALVLGLILVIFPKQAGDYLVITSGVVFMVPSLISLISFFTRKERRRFPVEGLGAFLFGLWLIIMPGFFADLLVLLLGFVLMLAGLHQVITLVLARKVTTVGIGYYVVPVLILIAGIVALFNPTGVRSTAFVIIGVSCLVYVVSEGINWYKFTRHRNSRIVIREEDIEDAQIEE